jgi:hypothetical protein
MQPLCQLRLNAETHVGKRPPRRNKCEKDERSVNPETGWWATRLEPGTR